MKSRSKGEASYWPLHLTKCNDNTTVALRAKSVYGLEMFQPFHMAVPRNEFATVGMRRYQRPRRMFFVFVFACRSSYLSAGVKKPLFIVRRTCGVKPLDMFGGATCFVVFAI